MKYFTERKDDIEGYMKNLATLKDRLDQKTYSLMLSHSFHDSELQKIVLLNQTETQQAKRSPVSLLMEVHHPNNHHYTLLWKDVSQYSMDFDIRRNKLANSNQILFERGLDQWSHDEILQTEDNNLRHEIILFSQTNIIIECKEFSIID